MKYFTVETEDSIFPLGQSKEYSYLQFDNIRRSSDENVKSKTGDVLYKEWFNLQKNNLMCHQRQVYSLFDLLGDIGGIKEILFLVLNLLFS